jgi:hypothetical protein
MSSFATSKNCTKDNKKDDSHIEKPKMSKRAVLSALLAKLLSTLSTGRQPFLLGNIVVVINGATVQLVHRPTSFHRQPYQAAFT